jgi:hypothetical protein
MREKRNAYKGLVGKPERKRTLGKPRSRWENCTKMDLKEVGWEVVDWIHLTRDKDGKQFRVP